MVKRILVQAGVHGPHPEGQYVKYEDYAALKADRDYWYEKCFEAGLLDDEKESEKVMDELAELSQELKLYDNR